MKTSGSCPKCASTRLYIVDEVSQPKCDVRGASPLRVKTTRVTVTKPALFGGVTDVEEQVEVGTFEAYVCAECGYTEWNARHLEELGALAAKPGTGVRLVDGGGPRSPFR